MHGHHCLTETCQYLQIFLLPNAVACRYSAKQYPEKLAIVDGFHSPRMFTYQQLCSRTCAAAEFLRTSCGVTKGTRVAVLLRNCSEVLELHYAAAALHAVVVNLNVNLAPQELRYILQDCGARVLVASPDFRTTLAEALSPGGHDTQQEGVCDLQSVLWVRNFPSATAAQGSLDGVALPQLAGLAAYDYEADCEAQFRGGNEVGFDEFAAAREAVAAEKGFSGEDGYHMYYTSGTTGRPKGVVLSHRIVVLHALGTIKGKNQMPDL